MDFIHSQPTDLYKQFLRPGMDRPNTALLRLKEILDDIPNQLLSQASLKTLVLTATTQVLHFVHFAINDCRKDFQSIDEEHMRQIRLHVAGLKGRTREDLYLRQLDEETAQKADDLIKDIESAMRTSRQLTNHGADNNTGEMIPWQPFNNSANYLLSNAENNFLSGLRGLYLRSSGMTYENVLQELINLPQEIHYSELLSSPYTTDTAVRAVLAIIGEIRTRCPPVFEAGRNVNMAELTTFYFQLNRSSHAQREEIASDVHKEIVKHRARELHNSMEIVRITLERPAQALRSVTAFGVSRAPSNARFPIEMNMPQPKIATVIFCESISLWRKLKNKSVADLLEENDEQVCPVCKDKELAMVNFAILDQCKHLFCTSCIETCFADKPSCPICKINTVKWTTKERLVAYTKNKEASRSS